VIIVKLVPESQGISGSQIVKETIAEAYFLAAKKGR